jgi:uncharacterized protein (TIGR02145 family)
MGDGREWTTENLGVEADRSYCYDESEANCRRYGRLYTWEAARRACRSLGPGWRLPTDDDWRTLARAYGGIREESSDEGKKAYERLLGDPTIAFHAALGGNRSPDGHYERLEAHGFYWSDSESEGGAVFYNFGKGGLALNRQTGGEKTMAASVRCISD